MGLNTVTLVIGIVVLCVLVPLAATASCTDSISCIFHGKRYFNCSIMETTGENYTCHMTPIDSGLTCTDVKTWLSTSVGTENCGYSCVEDGNCVSGLVAAQITCQHHNTTCQVFTLNDYIKPGPVLNLEVVNTTDKSVRVEWNKPDDYDNTLDRYIYTVQLETDTERRNNTRETKNNEHIKFKFRKLKPWTWGTVTVTAKSTLGGFPSEPVSVTFGDRHSSDYRIVEEGDRTGLIIGIVLTVLLLMACAVIFFVYKCKKEWWPTLPITLPKERGDIPQFGSRSLDKEKQDRGTLPPLPQDSGRGSMETNNKYSSSQEGDQEPLVGAESEKNDTVPPANHGEVFSEWDDCAGSSLSAYRQCPKGIGVKDSNPLEVKFSHTNPWNEGPSVSTSFSHQPQHWSSTEASLNSGSLPETVGPYSAVSLQTEERGISSSKEVNSRSFCTKDRGFVHDMVDMDNSGGSCLSDYRQVPGVDNKMETSRKGKSEMHFDNFVCGSFGDSCNETSPHALSASSDVPLLHSPSSLRKHVTYGTSNNATDTKGHMTDNEWDEWDDIEGSGLSAYRQVPGVSGNTEDSKAGRGHVMPENDVDSLSVLSNQSQNTSLSSLSLSTSAQESVTSYSAVSTPNTGNHTEPSLVPLLHSPSSPRKQFTYGTSKNTTDTKGHMTDDEWDEWDDIEGSGLSAYRQVPGVSGNTQDSKAGRDHVMPENDVDSVSVLSNQSQNTSLSSLSLSTSVSTPNTDNHTEPSLVSSSLTGSWATTSF